jgi:putative ABC transport system permease protein
MRDLMADLRFAARALLARRSFAAAAILTLAIGIGLTTSIFSVLNAVVLRPLPLRNADRLITLCEQYPGATPDWCSVAPPNVADIAARAHTIEAIGIGRSWPYTMATPDGSEGVRGGLASNGMFEALGIRAELGRLIERTDLLGRPSTVAVISHEMWASRFGLAPDIIGRTVTLDGAPVAIVGVLEPRAQVPMLERVALWRPLDINPRDEQHREWRGFVAYARLRDGASLATARTEIAAITRDLRAQHFSSTVGWDVTPRSLHDLVVGNVRDPLLLFFGAVVLVLLIACANVANLLLARGAARGREMGIRAALGASRARMVRSLLVESLLLAVVGAAIGLGMSEWATQAFKTLAPAGIPRIDQVATSTTVMVFAAALAVVTSGIFGLVPALRISRVDLAQSLREGGRGGSARSGRLSQMLVVIELAIALPLVTGAALLSRGFVASTQWRPGFEREHLLTFSMFIPNSSYAKQSDIGQIWTRLEREMASIPGVRSVGTASAGPLFGARETWEMEIEGKPADERQSIRWFDVSPGFFATLGVPIMRGEDFDASDVYGAPSAGLVNETLANRYWPGDSPIGKHLVFPHGADKETFTVKGVVRDVPPILPGTAAAPELYWSNRQAPRAFTYFLVRTTVPPASVTAAIRARLRAVDSDFKPAEFATMMDRVNVELRAPRFSMTLLIAFGLAALALAGIGTYGLLAYFVEQRQKDIGIRLALGAQRDNVVFGVMRNGLALAVPGIVIGIAGSMLLTRAIRSLVSGVSPLEPLSLATSVVVVLGVAMTACLVPAWRASRVDPAATLTAE